MKKVTILYFSLCFFIILFILLLLFAFYFNETVRQQKDQLKGISNQYDRLLAFINVSCKQNVTIIDIQEARRLAENYLVSRIPNAQEINTQKAYLTGNSCVQSWEVVTEYTQQDRGGVAFLNIDAVKKRLVGFYTFTCPSDQDCEYRWFIGDILGETLIEAQNSQTI